MTTDADPVYSASSRYLGEEGDAYFAYQSGSAMVVGRLLADAFREYVVPDATVLDFGAGTGAMLHFLPGRRKIAVEINPTARQACRQSFGAEMEVHADLSAVESNSVDVCVSNHCLEHVPFPIAALREIHRVLKRHGKLALRVPLDDWRTQKTYRADDVNHHLHTWTPLLLGHTLKESGFEKFSIVIESYAWPPRFQLADRLLPKPLFHAACRVFARIVKRRQLLAVSEKL